MADFTDSLEKIMLGAPRGIVLSPADRERTAYHESGHALVGMLTPGADPVRKVSIIPRGMALGVTLSTPDTDRVSYSREELEAQDRRRARRPRRRGGRLRHDHDRRRVRHPAAHRIARQMVGRWGMSDAIGPIAVLPSDGRVPASRARARPPRRPTQLIDDEVRRIVDEAHADVTALLTEHRDQLERSRARCSRRRRSTRPTPTPPRGRRPTSTSAEPLARGRRRGARLRCRLRHPGLTRRRRRAPAAAPAAKYPLPPR